MDDGGPGHDLWIRLKIMILLISPLQTKRFRGESLSIYFVNKTHDSSNKRAILGNVSKRSAGLLQTCRRSNFPYFLFLLNIQNFPWVPRYFRRRLGEMNFSDLWTLAWPFLSWHVLKISLTPQRRYSWSSSMTHVLKRDRASVTGDCWEMILCKDIACELDNFSKLAASTSGNKCHKISNRACLAPYTQVSSDLSVDNRCAGIDE